MDSSTKADLGWQLSYPSNPRKGKWESEDSEEPSNKRRKTLSFSPSPGQQISEDSNTVKMSPKRKREDTEDREHVKKTKLSPSQQDESEDSSSNEKWPSGERSDVERQTNSSSSSSSVSEVDCCSSDTVEDLSRDRQNPLGFVFSNPSSRDSPSFSEEDFWPVAIDQEYSPSLPNPDEEKPTSDFERIPDPCEGTSNGSVTVLTSNDRNSRIVLQGTYKQEEMIGKGAYGSVFAGYRRSDHLPVAIKHISFENVMYTAVSLNGKKTPIPLEVALLLTVQDIPAVVPLLDWYDLGSEVVLVMERPENCVNLFDYVNNWGGLEEDFIKTIIQQLVDAFTEIHSRGVLHRDVKLENILIEYGSGVPCVRIIDFGCGSLVESDENKEPVTVWQIGEVLYNVLQASLATTLEMTKDCHNFLSACLRQTPETRPSLQELQYHSWLNPNKDSFWTTLLAMPSFQ